MISFKHFNESFGKLTLMLFAIMSLALVTSCSDDDNGDTSSNPNEAPAYKTPKYIFFLIGDGMGAPQINVTEAALNDDNFKKVQVQNDIGIGSMAIRQFPIAGMATTYAQDRYITGSAAAGTALATGKKTTINTISMDGNHSSNYKTMAEMAKEKGMKVGIISSVSIDHATPACFYAHTETRNNYYTIGQHLTQSNFDYFAGGGVRWNKYSGEGQAKDINLFLNAAQSAGYKYVDTKSGFDALKPGDSKVIATLELFKTYTSDGCALPYVIDLDEQTSPNNQITLSEFTKKGIELLDNEKGFFMMVEGGKIDWACHANDVVSAAHNTIEFDKCIQHALDFYNQHPDETLIIVTGDHECGGLTLGYASTAYESAFSLLNNQKVSYWSFTEKVMGWAKEGTISFEEAMAEAKAAFGIGDESKGLGLSEYELKRLEDGFNSSMKGESIYSDDEIAFLYGYYDPFTVTITHLLNNKAGIDWTSYSHTGVPVPVFAIGQGMYEFSGYYDNVDIGNKIIKIAELNK